MNTNDPFLMFESLKLIVIIVIIIKYTLRENCANTELYLIRIFLYSDWTRRFTFGLNTEISGVNLQENTDQK